MMGWMTPQSERGITPRAVDLLFNVKKVLEVLGWKYKIPSAQGTEANVLPSQSLQLPLDLEEEVDSPGDDAPLRRKGFRASMVCVLPAAVWACGKMHTCKQRCARGILGEDERGTQTSRPEGRQAEWTQRHSDMVTQ